MFSNPRTKRRAVHMVLLVWLFALASGLANACLTQERGTHWHEPSDDVTLTAQIAQVSAGHVGVDSEHAESVGPGKGACLKVCDDNNQSVIKLASSVDSMDVAMAPHVALVWQVQLRTAEPDNVWLASPALSPRVPLRTRFARLAL